MADLDTLTLPVLPLTDDVVLPGMVVTLALESDEARAAADAAANAGDTLLLVPRHADGRYARVGTVARIENRGNLPGGKPALVIRATVRAEVGLGVIGETSGLLVHSAPVDDGEITDDLRQFLGVIDTFFFATASADGQPYIQHRGGPPGFLKTIGSHTLAFADFAGNRQYITLGHLKENDRAHIFILHFATRQRIKLWGRARVVEGDLELMERLVDPRYKARPERAIVFTLEAWDVNCQHHILPRYSEAEIAPAVDRLGLRIKELEEEVARLKNTTGS